MSIKRIFQGISVTAAAVAATALMAPAAHADFPPDGTQMTCGRNVDASGFNGLGLYYNSNFKGTKRCIFGDVYSYDANSSSCSSQGCAPYYFEWDGRNGQGSKVKNSAASAYNYDDTHVYRVYYNSGFGGSMDEWGHYGYGTYAGNLNLTYNNNASQRAYF